MAYSKSQKKLASQLIKIGKKRGESPKEIKSALATAIVEANLSNPTHGHGTSVGWRQEIDTYGSVKNRTNVRKSTNRYYDETSSVGNNGKGYSVGQLSQAVQRSAYPDRYGEVAGSARSLYQELSGKGVTKALSGSQGRSRRSLPPRDNTGKLEAKEALKQALFNFVQTPDKSFTDYLAIHDAEMAVKQAKQASKQEQLTSAEFGGVKVQAKGKEPKYRSKVELPKGAKVNDVLDLANMAQRMGLTVGEHPRFGGVAPVHTAGSFHDSGRAIDVTGDARKLAKFANVVGKKYGPKLAELFWNGKREENWDEGRRVGKGYVSGHDTHVHVAV